MREDMIMDARRLVEWNVRISEDELYVWLCSHFDEATDVEIQSVINIVL